MCNSGCSCIEGFARNDDNKCVKFSDCPGYISEFNKVLKSNASLSFFDSQIARNPTKPTTAAIQLAEKLVKIPEELKNVTTEIALEDVSAMKAI
jgi:hypothetical protein